MVQDDVKPGTKVEANLVVQGIDHFQDRPGLRVRFPVRLLIRNAQRQAVGRPDLAGGAANQGQYLYCTMWIPSQFAERLKSS